MSSSIAFDIIARDRASDKFDRVGRSAGGASQKLKQFAKVGALAAAAGAVMLGRALVDMTKSAMEDQKAQLVLATSMKNTAGATKGQIAATERWITAQGKAKGIADDELRPAMSRLVQATGDVSKSQRLAGLAMDVSAGTGKSLKQVTDALAKAQTGSLAGLSKLGVATKNADGSTKSLAQVTKDLAKVHEGQSAKAADTAEGKFRRLKVMFDETKETIGAKLIPIAGKLADWFMTKVMPAVKKVGDWIQTNLVPALKKMAEDVMPRAVKTIDALKKGFQDARPFLKLAGDVLVNVIIPVLGKLIKFQFDKLAVTFKAIGKVLGFVGDAATTMWNDAMQPAFVHMANAISGILGKLGAMFTSMGSIKGAPGWIGKTGTALTNAAGKAKSFGDSIKKIPTSKTISIVTVYTSRSAGKERSMGGGEPGSEGLPFSPRVAITNANTAATKIMEALAQAFKKSGKKAQDAFGDNIDRMREKLATLRSDMAGLSSSVAGAFNPDTFGSTGTDAETDADGNVTKAGTTALQDYLAAQGANGNNIGAGNAAFDKLKAAGGSSTWLTSLFQSGNQALIDQLAGSDGATIMGASNGFDSNAAAAKALGDKVGMNEFGPKIETAIRDEVSKLKTEVKDQPRKIGKEMKEALREVEALLLSLGTSNVGQAAYTRTGRRN